MLVVCLGWRRAEAPRWGKAKGITGTRESSPTARGQSTRTRPYAFMGGGGVRVPAPELTLLPALSPTLMHPRTKQRPVRVSSPSPQSNRRRRRSILPSSSSSPRPHRRWLTFHLRKSPSVRPVSPRAVFKTRRCQFSRTLACLLACLLGPSPMAGGLVRLLKLLRLADG
jgi:hypothetical protein